MALQNESSCLVQARWEWTTLESSNRWGDEFQAYRFRQPLFVEETNSSLSDGMSVITTRNKIRGKGRALSFRFRTEPGKDCKLLGWSVELGWNREV